MDMNEENIRILVADDDEAIRTTLEFILQEENFQVAAVHNGGLALKKVSEEFFNIAVLDYKLPDMDGLILGKNIKEREW